MGIGQLYKTVLTNLGAEIITVDSDISKGADFPDALAAIIARGPFDTAHICTPNHTHFTIATKIAHDCRIVFIEKPGVANASNWATLVHSFPDTRFMMVKNNMWRDNIEEIRLNAESADEINFNWINRDRVPSPGSWFTTRKLSFGGVSRDLMPHLLSLYIALNPNWIKTSMTHRAGSMRWHIKDLVNTEYGKVNPDGVYDVDDVCSIDFGKWKLTADWRSMDKDRRNIEMRFGGSVLTHELGLCPEYAYEHMIKEAYERQDDKKFWDKQFLIDYWIHERIEQF
jgi:predicted dehydrogenase